MLFRPFQVFFLVENWPILISPAPLVENSTFLNLPLAFQLVNSSENDHMETHYIFGNPVPTLSEDEVIDAPSI